MSGASAADANWQDINVESIGGGSFSNGYLTGRAFLFFDTSAIPSSATIESAVLYIHAGQWPNGNATIHVVHSNAGPPLSTSSFQDFINVSGGSATLTTPFAWASINLDSSALSWIMLGGTTSLALIYDNDLNDRKPSEQNDVIIASGEDTVNRPYLTIITPFPRYEHREELVHVR